MALIAGAPPARTEDAQALFAQGYELYKGGLYKGAIALFEQGLASEPNNGLAHFYLAECHYKQGSLAPALEHYRQAATLLPEGDDKTRSGNLALAIEAELGAGSTTTDTGEASSAAEPTTTTAVAPIDWPSLVSQDAGVSEAIKAYYDENQPAPEAQGSRMLKVFSLRLAADMGDRAIVTFRCEIRASHGKTGIFRARATLSTNGSTPYVIEFKQDERFDIVKGFAY